MAPQSSEESGAEGETAFYFSPKTSAEHLRNKAAVAAGTTPPDGSTPPVAGGSGNSSRRGSKQTAASYLATNEVPARETSPLRGNRRDSKGKGKRVGSSGHDQDFGYESASSSSLKLQLTKSQQSGGSSRYADGEDYDEHDRDDALAALSYGAGFDSRRTEQMEPIPTLPRLFGGSNKTLDGTLPHHLPTATRHPGKRAARRQQQGVSEYSTVEMLPGAGDKARKHQEPAFVSADARKREYWRSALINVSLILCWCG